MVGIIVMISRKGFTINRIPSFFILLVTHLSVILIVITLFSYSAYKNSRELYIDKANTSTNKLMEQVSTQLNSKVKSIIDVCFDITRNDELLRILEVYDQADMYGQVEYENKIKDILYYYWKFSDQISNVVLFVKDKKFVSDYRNGVCPVSKVSGYDWFKLLGEKTGVLIDTRKFDYITNIKAQNVTTALVKIKSKNRVGEGFSAGADDMETELGERDYLGIIDIDISEEYIYKNSVDTLKFSDSSEVFLISRDHTIISASDKQLIGTKFNKNVDTELLNRKAGGYEKIKVDGIHYLFIYTGISDIGWRIIQLIPTSDIYEGEDQSIKTVGTTIFTSFLVVLPIVIIISRMLSSPIKKLADRMNSVKSRKFDKITHATYSREITELYGSYNYMVEEIKTLLSDIKNAGEIQRQTEIKALQAQINPHFLYNTLDSINWMALEYNASDISKMVTMLSRLFRLSLSKGSSVYRVKDELGQVAYYLEIQKIRFKNRFSYVIEANEVLHDFYIPKLILQPLVENSILHGFMNLAREGHIRIAADICEGNLFIDLEDNGAGIPKEKASEILTSDSKEGGYGIKNVHERIQYICGEGYGLEYIFENRTGTHVRIRLPVITHPDELKQ